MSVFELDLDGKVSGEPSGRGIKRSTSDFSERVVIGSFRSRSWEFYARIITAQSSQLSFAEDLFPLKTLPHLHKLLREKVNIIA